MDSERRQTDNTSGDRNGGWNLKQYVVIGLVVFITFCCCILFFFMIYRYNGFADFWKKLTTILQPIIMGLVLAYLLNPVMKFLERHLMKLLEPRMKSKTKAKKMSRGVAIAGAWVFLGGIVVLLIAAIVPSIIQSIQGIATGLPSEVKNIMDWSDEFFKGDSEIVGVINDVLQKASDAVQKFLENDLLAQVQVYLTSIASGVIYTLKFLLNLVVGIIVSIYVLASQETFAGQAKKIIYAMFKPVRANVIVETVRKSNEIFGGFISGKLLDSAIIGILAYVVLTIMRMPDTILLAVIIGVTNIIPFFGPFIGAIPSFLIVVLQNPLQGVYFLIFIFILQQIDGNIIGPKILGDSTGLSSFWVVFAILVFGGLWGFPGMLLGVPLMAVIYYVAQKLVSYFLRKRGLVDDTGSYIHLMRIDKRTNELVYEEKTEPAPELHLLSTAPSHDPTPPASHLPMQTHAPRPQWQQGPPLQSPAPKRYRWQKVPSPYVLHHRNRWNSTALFSPAPPATAGKTYRCPEWWREAEGRSGDHPHKECLGMPASGDSAPEPFS